GKPSWLGSGSRTERLELAVLGELGERPPFELADRVLGDPEPAAGLAERRRIVAVDPVAELHDLALAVGEAVHRAPQRVLAERDVDLLLRSALVAGQQRPEGGLLLFPDGTIEARDHAGCLSRLPHLVGAQLRRGGDLVVGRLTAELRGELT